VSSFEQTPEKRRVDCENAVAAEIVTIARRVIVVFIFFKPNVWN